jgi:site-specific recombinase XerD
MRAAPFRVDRHVLLAVFLGTGAHVRVLGKGRKERATPLTRETAAVLKAWLCEIPDSADAIVFPSARGTRLSSDGIEYLVAKYVVIAAKACPSLAHKRVTPHVLRHTAAMELLQAGVDRSLIALLLGHESVETTQIYLDANLAMKEQALAKAAPPGSKAGRYHPDDQLLAFLKGL